MLPKPSESTSPKPAVPVISYVCCLPAVAIDDVVAGREVLLLGGAGVDDDLLVRPAASHPT